MGKLPLTVRTALVLLLAGTAGCRSVPFRAVTPVSVRDWDAAAVPERFAERLTDRFEERHAATFSLPFFRMSGLGAVVGHRRERTFSLVCMTHTGVTLFALRGEPDAVHVHFMPPEMEQRPEIARAIGEDARRMFFDLTPGEQAAVRRRRTRLTYIDRGNGLRIEYDFAGADAVLTEKRIYRNGRKLATIGYYEYRRDPESGAIAPGGIVLRNRQHGYSLILRRL
jgi:hypothetical protein